MNLNNGRIIAFSLSACHWRTSFLDFITDDDKDGKEGAVLEEPVTSERSTALGNEYEVEKDLNTDSAVPFNGVD